MCDDRFSNWLWNQMSIEELNISGLARKLDVSDVTVGYWLRDCRRPDDGNIAKLARFFQIHPAVIYRQLGLIPGQPRDPDLERVSALWNQVPEWKRKDVVQQLVDAARRETERREKETDE
jgi:hypothetical protein